MVKQAILSWAQIDAFTFNNHITTLQVNLQTLINFEDLLIWAAGWLGRCTSNMRRA